MWAFSVFHIDALTLKQKRDQVGASQTPAVDVPCLQGGKASLRRGAAGLRAVCDRRSQQGQGDLVRWLKLRRIYFSHGFVV